MPTFAEFVARIRGALAVTEPYFDTTVGTTPRKMIDVFAEITAEISADQRLMAYQYDVDAKSGADLDAFVANFGFARRLATRATGAIALERTTPAEEPIWIPVASRFSTEDTPGILFESVVNAVLPRGETLVVVPVQAVAPGTEGNVLQGRINRAATPVTGVSSVSNPAAMTGGTDPESDTGLRARFKATAFRSLAGTEGMYLGVALEDPDVTQARVLGAAQRFQERIELVGGTAESTLVSAKHVYPADLAFFGQDIEGGDHFVPGVHYEFDPTVFPPTVTSLDPVTVPDGLYDLDFAYLSAVSRNDPDAGITNRVDVYVNNERIEEAVETLVFVHTAFGDPGLDPADFQRLDETQPQVGNFFQRFAFAPATSASVTGQIVVDGITYNENEDFWLVNDITPDGGMSTSRSGIEWRSVANGAGQDPPVGEVFSVTHNYNAIPRDLTDAIRVWRLVTTDAAFHAARVVRLRFHLAVMLESGIDPGGAEDEIAQAIQRYLAGVGLRGVVQVSDIINVAYVPGVDAVRVLTSADDPTDYAIQRVQPDGTVLETYATADVPARAIDILLDEDQTPVFHSLRVEVRGQNVFGVV